METNVTSKILRSLLQQKIEKNPAYSSRAFARDIGVSPGFVSLVLNGKKKLSVKKAMEIVQTLKLTDDEAQGLLRSVIQQVNANFEIQRASLTNTEFFEESMDRFRTISDWYHVAILDLMSTKKSRTDARWISKRLRITVLEAQTALDRLFRLGLLKDVGGKFKKVNRNLFFEAQATDASIREHHRQMISKALNELQFTDEESFSARWISSYTISINPKRVSEAKRKIQLFMKELSSSLAEGESEEVYQFNVQFFPLTKSGGGKG